MPKYLVTLYEPISTFYSAEVLVDAEAEEEAKTIALNMTEECNGPELTWEQGVNDNDGPIEVSEIEEKKIPWNGNRYAGKEDDYA